MKHKVLLVAAGLFVAGAGVTGGLVFGLKAYRNKIEAEQNKVNNEAKKINADYDNKSQTDASKVDVTKIKFSGIDFDTYEITIKSVTVSPTDNTRLLVTVVITKKSDKSYNKEIVITIDGFKKPADTKEILNKKVEKVISVSYKEDTKDIFAKDAKEENIIFEGVEDGYTTSIKNLSTKLNDQTVLVIVFTLKEINETLESDIKTLEISGFKQPTKPLVAKTKEELNDILKLVNKVTYDGLKNLLRVIDIDKNKLIFTGLPSGYTIKIISVSPKENMPIIAVIKISIQENGGQIFSDEKSYEIPGFRKPFLDKKQLDDTIDKINSATYGDGNNSSTEVKDIDSTKIIFNGLDDNFEAKIIDIKPKNDDTSTAVITFTIKEKDGSDSSKNVVVEIPGFKKLDKTKEELNKEIEKINNVVYNENNSTTEVKDIDSTKIIFSDLDNKYEAEITKVIKKATDSTIAVISFKIKEKNGSIFSDEKDLEISGFKKEKLTKEQLNKILEEIKTLEFNGDKSQIEVKDIDRNSLKVDIKNSNIKSTITNIDSKNTDKTVAIIKLKISETNGSIESDEKTFEVPGFKKPLKTKAELDAVLKAINKLSYQEKFSNLEVSEIDRSKLVFEPLEKEYEVRIIDVNTKSSTETSIASVQFRIREKNGSIYSEEKTLELNGFKKASKTSTDLHEALYKITSISYTGNKAQTEVKNIDKTKLVFENLGDEYTTQISSINTKYNDSTIATITFSIKEKNGTTLSVSRTIEIEGFKKPNLEKAEIDIEIDKINMLSYLGKKSDVEVKNIEKDKIQIINLGVDFVANIIKVEEDPTDKTTAKITFSIKEKTGTIQSKTKELKIYNFKQPQLTLDELNQIINRITTIQYAGFTKNVTVRKIDPSLIRIVGLDTSKLDVIFTNIAEKTSDPTTAVIKFKISEKTGIIQSNERALEIKGFKVPELTIDEINAVLNVINSATYLGDKSKTEVKNIIRNNIKFDNLTSQFNAAITNILSKKNNPTVALISFKINEVGKTTFSNEKTIEVSGFKKPPLTKQELNSLFSKIRAQYNGRKSEILVQDVKKEDVEFYVSNNDIEIKIISITPKDSDKTVAVIEFIINQKGESTISDETTVEISGFMLPSKTTEELNQVISAVSSAIYTGDKRTTTVENIERNKISFLNLANNYQPTIVSVSASKNSPTTAIIRFKISENGKNIFSNEKELVITEFKKPSLSKDELDQIINDSIKVIYTKEKNKTPVLNINSNDLRFEISDKNFDVEITVTKVSEKTADSTTALIEFTINEKGQTTLSSVKKVEISGFRKPFLTQQELDGVLDRVDHLSYAKNNPNQKANTKVKDIDKRLIGLEKLDSGFKWEILGVFQDNKDPSIALISFRIKETDGTLNSKTVTYELKGFKGEDLSKDDINNLLSNINKITYQGDKSRIEVNKLDKRKLLFENTSNLANVNIVSINPKRREYGTAVIEFNISDKKNPKNISENKTLTIQGFRDTSLTKRELNHVMKSVRMDYRDKNRYIVNNQNDVDKLIYSDFFVRGIDPKKFAVVLLKKQFYKRGQVIITVVVEEKKSGNISDEHKFKIRGFKSSRHSRHDDDDDDDDDD